MNALFQTKNINLLKRLSCLYDFKEKYIEFVIQNYLVKHGSKMPYW